MSIEPDVGIIKHMIDSLKICTYIATIANEAWSRHHVPNRCSAPFIPPFDKYLHVDVMYTIRMHLLPSSNGTKAKVTNRDYYRLASLILRHGSKYLD